MKSEKGDFIQMLGGHLDMPGALQNLGWTGVAGGGVETSNRYLPHYNTNTKRSELTRCPE